jgi:hypothetical protein
VEQNLQIEKFNQFKADALKIVDEVKDLKIKGLDDKAGYEAVRSGKMKLVRHRTSVKEERMTFTRVLDKLKKDAIKLENEITELTEPAEKRLADDQAAYEQAHEMIKREKSLPERKERLATINETLGDEFLFLMDDKQFDEFFSTKKTEYLEEKERMIKAEEERQAQIKLENEREAQRLKDIETARQEEAERARQQAETDRIKAETEKENARIRAEQEKELALKKAEEEKQLAIENERRKAEKEKQDLIDEQNRKEAERLKKIEDDRRDEEDRIRKEKEEAEKQERKKKYIKFLKDHGYTEELKDNFETRWEGKKAILWKKIGEVNL